MKQKLLLKTMLLLFALVAETSVSWADETVDFTQLGKQSWSSYSLTSGDITISTDLNNGSTPTTNSDQYRWKTGNIITISTVSGTLKSIQFYTNSSAAYGPKCLSYNSSAITSSGIDYTWTAPSGISSASFTVTSEARLTEIHVTYVAGPSYIITPQSNNNTYGTVSLTGTTITGNPASGCRYASPAYTVTTGTATVSQEGDAFSVTPASDCTITINFEPTPTHTATFSVNGATTTGDFEEGEAITFPSDPADINGKTFMGWVTEAIVGSTNSEPSFVTSATMSTSDITYYAVFATEESGAEENTTKTITASTTNIPGAYGTRNTFTEYTLEGIKFEIQQMYKNGDKLQWRAAGNENGTGTMYNTDDLNKIQSIVLTYDSGDSNKNFTVKVGDSRNPTSGTSITPTNEESVYTFDCSSYNKSYFVLTNGTGAGYLKSIAITYKTIGPNTYSAYCTTVSALPVPTITFTDENDVEITELNISSLNAMVEVGVSCSAGAVTLTFDSSNETVAEYDEGYILTYDEGTTTITATFAGNGSYQGTSAELVVNVERSTTTLSFPAIPETINLDATETYVATSTPSVSGITYSSSNPSAVEVDSETGEISAIALGTATITANFAGNDDYKPTSTSYNIRVVDPNLRVTTLTNGKIVEAGERANGYGEKTITDSYGKTWNAYAIKNQHSNNTSNYHFLQIRAYQNNTAYYIQVPAYGRRITQLKMTISGSSAPMDGDGFTGTLFFSSSNATTSTGSGVASTSVVSANSVTIDCSSLNLNTGYITSSGAVRIWDVEVTYEYKINVGTALWTTHVTADAVDFTGVTAYIVKSVGSGSVSLEKVTTAPANTPVIINATASKNYYFTTVASPASVTGNLLQASDGTVTGNGSIYALGVGKTGANEGEVGFYLVGTGVTVPEGKAYLTYPSSIKEFLTFSFDDDDPDGINAIDNGESTNDNATIYNLAGQRLNKMQKGINIINGRKVLK